MAQKKKGIETKTKTGINQIRSNTWPMAVTSRRDLS